METCAICHEMIQESDGTNWIHTHSRDEYCGTGDGATAYPTHTNQDGDK
ncbi:Uncharacterised protein [Mycobacteroides abscessus subsp. abscessus]|nr:Uncharacterised protein [Mycobacteroides abscessus subsp. abscessus]